jgi:hypothetical protein
MHRLGYRPSADQNRFIDCPVRFQANRLKNFFPSEWHRDHQIVYVKADLLKVVGRVPGGILAARLDAQVQVTPCFGTDRLQRQISPERCVGTSQ